jgi:hypothetical protein
MCEQKTTSIAFWVETDSMKFFSASDTVQFSMGAMIWLFKQFIMESFNGVEGEGDAILCFF